MEVELEVAVVMVVEVVKKMLLGATKNSDETCS